MQDKLHDDPIVRHNETESRFELAAGGQQAFAEYRRFQSLLKDPASQSCFFSTPERMSYGLRIGL